MAITSLTANGTYYLKDNPGYITSISVPNAGSAWTLQLFDGPGKFNNAVYNPIYGGSAGGAITTGLSLTAPLYFGNGIKIVLAGTTAGEIDIQWE